MHHLEGVDLQIMLLLLVLVVCRCGCNAIMTDCQNPGPDFGYIQPPFTFLLPQQQWRHIDSDIRKKETPFYPLPPPSSSSCTSLASMIPGMLQPQQHSPILLRAVHQEKPHGSSQGLRSEAVHGSRRVDMDRMRAGTSHFCVCVSLSCLFSGGGGIESEMSSEVVVKLRREEGEDRRGFPFCGYHCLCAATAAAGVRR